MTDPSPPTIDATAAHRWAALEVPSSAHGSPWLHEEVARRMEQRLQWIVKRPRSWLHWQALRGGQEAHTLLRARYPSAQCFAPQEPGKALGQARAALQEPWWSAARWKNPTRWDMPSEPVEMLWANMVLHTSPQPQALIQKWHQLLDIDGFLMFSCLGPDTLREVRDLYARQSWPAPAHEFTDMHDWGDMLVEAGFAEPVMDMERMTLTFSSPAALLEELRGLGRNLHPQRFPGLRTRGWRAQLEHILAKALADTGQAGRLPLSFEIIYGHAFKPAPRIPVAGRTSIPLDQMRTALRAGRSG